MRVHTRRLSAAVLSMCMAVSLLAGSVNAATPPNISQLSVPRWWQPSLGEFPVSFSVDGPAEITGTLTDICSGVTLANISLNAQAGKQSLSITPTKTVNEGTLQVSLTAKNSNNESAPAVSAITGVGIAPTSSGYVASACPNAWRVVSSPDSTKSVAQALIALQQESFDEAQAAVLVSEKAGPGFLAVAANYAHLRKLPLFISAKQKLTFATKQEIKSRELTRVIALGRTSDFDAKVMSELKALGIQVPVRLKSTPAELQSSIYRRATVKDSNSPVFVNLKDSKATVLLAVSYANSANRPLLDANAATSGVVRDLANRLDLVGGTVIGSSPAVSEQTLNALGAVSRVQADDERTLALALARSTPNGVRRIVVKKIKSEITAMSFAAVQSGVVVLPIADGTLSLAQRSWLNARGDVIEAATFDSMDSVSPVSLARVARLIAERGEPTVIPSVTPRPLGPLEAPPAFAFSGSGWGHGIGMSQWGAYAMAKAGKTAEEILTYYFTGTAVKPRVDDADVFVGICLESERSCYGDANRTSTIKMRLRDLENSSGQLRLQAADGTSITVTSKHTVTFSFVGGSTQVKTTIVGPDGLKLANSSMVVLTWTGTRFSQNLSGGAATVQVAGPGTELAAGRQYRFGSMRVKAAPAQSDLPAGLLLSNRVRLHDEYLYGIGEVSSSWPEAALEAQVIAARSYAYYDVYNSDGSLRPRRSACDCQVYGDVRDQNYVGWSKISSTMGERWKAAVDTTLVDETRGKVLQSGNTVVQTFFAAATGGSTQNNEDVWGGTPRSYLRSVPDPWSIAPPEAVTVSAWSPRVRSQAVVAKAFGLPDVASLDLSDRFASGGLRTVVATSTSGAKATLSGEKFRSTMVSDSGTTLMSTWVWRSVVSPKVTTPATVLPETVGNRLSEFAQVPMRSARQAVIVQSDKRDLVALASAYAGNTQSYLVLVRPTADASRVSQLLKTQQISSAVIIGEIDPAVRTVIPTTVGVTNLAGVSVNELSQKLASLLKAKPAHGVVLASTSEPSSLPLAVSLAVRTNRPLIVNDSPELSPETAAWLVNYSPGSITIVGSSSAISDSAVAGFPNATRLNTADLPIAAATILNIKPATHRSLTVIGTGTNLTSAIVLAALGNPILYPDADVTASIVPWLRRQHLLTLIINGGGSADFVETIRRA